MNRRLYSIFILIALCALSATVTAAPPPREPRVQLKRGESSLSFVQQIIDKASTNDPEALYILARLHLEAATVNGLVPDPSGLDFLEKAVALDYAPAQTYMARLLLLPQPTASDTPSSLNDQGKRAFALLEKAVDQGFTPACRAFAEAFLRLGRPDGLPMEKIATCTQGEARKGNPDFIGTMALFFEEGIGVPRDMEQAVSFYAISADRGDANAAVYLGKLYEDGVQVPQDLARAAQYYRIAAEDEQADGMYRLAVVLSNGGKGLSPAPIQAAALLLELGDASDQRFFDRKERLEKLERDLSPAQWEEARKEAEAWRLGAELRRQRRAAK